jgi:hypothetical protein
MRIGLVMMGVAACAGGQRADTRVDARDAITKAVADVGAMKKLLRGSVVNGGLWFDDPACKAQFPVGDVPNGKLGEFARCLVSLQLQPSLRKAQLGDVVVMNYAPGFEVEVRVVPDIDGARLQWIGFSAKRATDTLPTISGDALEARRLSGHRDGPLDATTAAPIDAELALAADGKKPKDFAFTWVKVCLDATGALTSVDSYLTTSSGTEAAFLAAARTWTFRPFVVRDQSIPVCAMVRMTHPSNAAPLPETIPMPPPPSRGKKRLDVGNIEASRGQTHLRRTECHSRRPDEDEAAASWDHASHRLVPRVCR